MPDIPKGYRARCPQQDSPNKSNEKPHQELYSGLNTENQDITIHKSNYSLLDILVT